MASKEFKEGVTLRFKEVYNLLIRRGFARNNSEVGQLMDISSGAGAKMLIGERIITLEQIAKLAQKTGINANHLLTGEGSMFIERSPDEDALVTISRLVNDGHITPADGEKIVTRIVELRKDNIDLKNEVVELNREIVELMKLIRKA